MDGYKTFILGCLILAGAYGLIVMNRMDALEPYANIAMWVCTLMGIREAGDKGLLKGIVNINKPSQLPGVDTKPGG